ncbi:Rhamnan synthesis protein F [Pseudorhodobacter antarcticus]|uniref:Rhamnan synthesis protein F n=1 Tax=Pseudorhodobacter antarcticus TaxID=1077947 RepID=A0A1H8MY35_9RHOB|nr:Rhamnan synthesis protein F [Pseudorhodobacter antarcticus]
MIPRWKLKRELVRLRDQIASLPQAIASLHARLSEPQRRRAHDAAFPQNLRVTEGKIVPSPRLAVVVLFQPHGIALSTLESCKGLVAGGYAPLVISNAILSDSDRALLAQTCWRTVERPNFGYDFGAYRDGIRMIREQGITPDRLILMNDSFWCAITPELLGKIEDLDADLSGLLQDEKVQHDTKGGKPTQNLHIESYCLFISARLWKAEAFRTFWDGYLMTNFKPRTIKNGEIGFSRKMKAAGFSLIALTNRGSFLTALSNVANDELQQVLRYAAYDDPVFRSEAAALLLLPAEGDAWRNKVLDHIRRWVNRRRFNTAFPLASGRIFGVSFLKKSHEEIFAAARVAYLRGCEDGLIQPASSAIVAELAQSVSSVVPTKR